MNICIIPARGGSQRIPGKNFKDFHGKPIVAYSIETARASKLFQKIIVSTDSPQIAALARQYGAYPHARTPEMARNEVGTQEVTRSVILDLYPNMGTHRQPLRVCCVYATCPMLTPVDLIRGRDLTLGHLRFSMAVGTEPLCDAGMFYWGEASMFIMRRPLIDPSTVMVPIPPERVCDINTMDDWHKAERMYSNLRPQNWNYFTDAEVL